MRHDSDYENHPYVVSGNVNLSNGDKQSNKSLGM